MKKNRLLLMSSVLLLMLLFYSCSETTKVELPTSAVIHYSVVDKQVAFTALTHSADSYLWDFGDGETSTEKDPVHIYQAGYYTATLSVTGKDGAADDSADLAIAITPYVLLTGGASAENGKTWKLNPAHSAFDYFANADAELTTYLPAYTPLPAGIFGNLEMGEVYEDEFTFHFDGSYEQDVKDDGASFGGIIYQFATTGGAGIVNANGADFGLCTGLHTPETDATFTYTESENYDVPSVYGPPTFVVTYEDVSTLDFSGTEFVGIKDFLQKVIVQEITSTSMRLAMFISASEDYAPLNTHALVLTFEVVD